MRPWVITTLTVLAWIWTAPNAIVHIVWILVYKGLREPLRWHDGYLEVETDRMLMFKAGGECFGRIIAYVGGPDGVREHERVHGFDASLLGPLYGPAYGIAGLIAGARAAALEPPGSRARAFFAAFYARNYWERRAKRLSGHGAAIVL